MIKSDPGKSRHSQHASGKERLMEKKNGRYEPYGDTKNPRPSCRKTQPSTKKSIAAQPIPKSMSDVSVMHPHMAAIRKLAQQLTYGYKILFITGAGLSVSSGIPT